MVFECLTDINTNNHSDRAVLLQFREYGSMAPGDIIMWGNGRTGNLTSTPPSTIYLPSFPL